ncbi:hypothetical protein [Nocardia sp. NPDC127526]|uniref:MmyB family transcriptional regulator n=1 Tax=Nocardia sp. NPDC127526 TaxID=3345393 RepID=UPI00363C799E
MSAPSGTPAADLAVLHSFPHPACLHDGAFDVLEANTAFRELFPGTAPGVNLLTSHMLEPMARYVLRDWEAEAQLMATAFRRFAPESVPASRIEEVLNLCRRAPEWDQLWRKADTAEIPRQRTAVVLSPQTHSERKLYVQTFRFAYPDRPWWLMTLVPFD